MIPLAVLVVAVAVLTLHGAFRRHSPSHAGPRHHGHSEGWDSGQDGPAPWLEGGTIIVHPPSPPDAGAAARILEDLGLDIGDPLPSPAEIRFYREFVDPVDGEPGGGEDPGPDCGGGPSDLHDDCQPSLEIRPFDGELTEEQMERFREGFREALRESAASRPSPGTEAETRFYREFVDPVDGPEPYSGFLAAPAVEATLPPLPSFTPFWPPRHCGDVPEPPPWTPPADLREYVASTLAGPGRSELGSWVDAVLAGQSPRCLSPIRPEWEDGGWAT